MLLVGLVDIGYTVKEEQVCVRFCTVNAEHAVAFLASIRDESRETGLRLLYRILRLEHTLAI